MSTKVYLHGGNAEKKSHKNEQFFQAIINEVDKDTVNILCVYFARPEGRWQDSYAFDQSLLRNLDTTKEIETMLATYDLDEFVANIEMADIILFSGGMRGRLKETIMTIGLDKFKHLINGKLLVGISAGANILSKYYYSSVAEGIREGTGLLNIKLLTHFRADQPEKLELLKAHRENLPIIKLAEEDYVVI